MFLTQVFFLPYCSFLFSLHAEFTTTEKSRQLATCHRNMTNHRIRLPLGCTDEIARTPIDSSDILGQNPNVSPEERYIDIGKCSLRPCALDQEMPPGADGVIPRLGDSCSLRKGSSCQPADGRYVLLRRITCSDSMEMYIPTSVACRCQESSGLSTEITGRILSRVAGEKLTLTSGRYRKKVVLANREFLLDASDEDSGQVPVVIDRGADRPEFITSLPILPGRRVLQNIILPRSIITKTFRPESGVLIHGRRRVSLFIDPKNSWSTSAQAAVIMLYLAKCCANPISAPGNFLERRPNGAQFFMQPIIILSAKFSRLQEGVGLDLTRMRLSFPLPESVKQSDLLLFSLGLDASWEKRETTITALQGPNRTFQATIPQVSGTWAVGLSMPLCEVMVTIKDYRHSSLTPQPVAGALVTLQRIGEFRAATSAVTDAWGIACVPAPCGVRVSIEARLNGDSLCSRTLEGGQCVGYNETTVATKKQCSFGQTQTTGSVFFTTTERSSKNFDLWPTMHNLYGFRKNSNTGQCYLSFTIQVSQSSRERLIVRAVSMNVAVHDNSTIPSTALLLGWREIRVEATQTSIEPRCIEVACPSSPRASKQPNVRVLLQVTRFNAARGREEVYPCKYRHADDIWTDRSVTVSSSNELSLLITHANVQSRQRGVFKSPKGLLARNSCRNSRFGTAAVLKC